MKAAKPAASTTLVEVWGVDVWGTVARFLADRRVRNSILSLCTLAFLAATACAQGQDGKILSEDSYTIRGVVVNSVTHAAVPHALAFSSDNRFAKLTDDEGRFEFKVPRPQPEGTSGSQTTFSTFSSRGVASRIVTSVSLIFLARKQGYFQSQAVQEPPGDENSRELKIEIVPEALMVGRVNLPANDGTEKIQVQIYKRQVQEGRATWVAAGGTTTRANGEFRLANLQEGEYKLFTQELLDRDPLTFNPRGQLFGYPPVYFPASGDFETAAVIQLKAGETFSATLTPARREYYPVKIAVLNAEAGNGLGIEVQPQGHKGPGFSLGYSSSAGGNNIQGMLPDGNYSVAVTGYGQNGSTGMANFSVSGGPVVGLSVMLAPNPAIEVHVRDERTKGDNGIPPGLRNLMNVLNVRLVPSEDAGQGNFLWLQPPKNPEDESLAFGNARPGSYSVRAGCHPAAYVASVSSGGKDLLRQPLVVGAGAAVPPLEITVRDDGAQVDGSIENWQPPQRSGRVAYGFPGNMPQILLLPLPDSTGQFCQAWATPEGEFHFPQVAPGEYRAVAVEGTASELEYGSAAAMKRWESKGQELRLVAGQKEHLRLKLESGSE